MKLFSERRRSVNKILYSLVTAALLTAVGVIPLQYAKAQDNPDDTFTLNLKNADISTLIETVAARTGRTFIVDPRVKATINVVSSETLNADKLYDLFLSVLAVHGFAAVQAGELTKIVPASVGIQSAVPIYSEDSNAEDDLVSRVIQLNNLSAPEVVEALRPLFPESASINAETTSNTIVITDSVANIEKLIELIVLIDKQ